MQWTLADIRSRVRALTGKQSTTRLSDLVLDSHINNYYQNQLPELISPTELQTFFTLQTSSGGGEYGLDQDMRAVFPPVWIDGAQAQLSHDPAWFFDMFPDRYEQTYQRPDTVLMFDRTFWLAPVPDDTYEIKATALARPSSLSSDADSPVDQRWGEAIAVGAAILVLRNDADHDEAQKLDGFLNYHLNLIRQKNTLSFQGMRPAPKF
mgnify:CR=1 FL=1